MSLRSRVGLVSVGLASLLAASLLAGAQPSGAATTGATNLQFGLGGAHMLFGNPNPGSRDNGYEILNELGVQWIRADFHWADIQPTKTGPYDWTKVDQVVNEARAHNLKVMAILQRTPVWARPAGTEETNPPVTAADLEGWRLFNKAFAQRYTTAANNKVQAVEVWNEPNHPMFWTGGNWGPRYVALLKKSYTEFKLVNPATMVITGGLAPAGDGTISRNSRTWLKEFYAAGGKGSFDAVGFHPYAWPNTPSANLDTGWNEMMRDDFGKPSLRTTMTANGDAAKKIWNTEFGHPSSWGGEAKQAAVMTDAVNLWKSYSWAGNFFSYSYKDDAGAQGSSQTSGLLLKGDVRKQAFGAYKAAIRAALPPATYPPAFASLLNLGGGNVGYMSGCVPGYCKAKITNATFTSKPTATITGAPGYEAAYRDYIVGVAGKPILIDVPVPAAGRYKTTFGFAELEKTAAGQRKFNIAVDSPTAPQTLNYDIFATAGAQGKVVTPVITQSITGTTLHIVVTPVVGVPVINTLVVERVG